MSMIGVGGASIQLGSDDIRQIQTRLNQMGYQPGNLAGVYDNQTAQAIGSFQQTQGLQATGQINPPTLQALGFNPQQFYRVAPAFGQQNFQQSQ